jgi:enamine deaminase RidA (YjgF/YER057c/UK114 family)
MRQHHRSASPFEEAISFSRAVRHGDRIEVAGTAPIGPDGETVDGGAFEQAERCFTIIREAIEALGGSMSGVIRTRMYIVDKADWEEVGRAHGVAFAGVNPAATMVLAQLLDERWRCEIEATAIVGETTAE